MHQVAYDNHKNLWLVLTVDHKLVAEFRNKDHAVAYCQHMNEIYQLAQFAAA